MTKRDYPNTPPLIFNTKDSDDVHLEVHDLGPPFFVLSLITPIFSSSIDLAIDIASQVAKFVLETILKEFVSSSSNKAIDELSQEQE